MPDPIKYAKAGYVEKAKEIANFIPDERTAKFALSIIQAQQNNIATQGI